MYIHSSQLQSSPYPPDISSVLRQLPLELLSEIFYVEVFNVAISGTISISETEAIVPSSSEDIEGFTGS